MRIIQLIALCLLIVLTLPACVLSIDCDQRADRNAEIDATGAARIEIEARAGDLVVRRAAGTQLTAAGKACASSGRLLEQIELRVERQGETVNLIAEMPETNGWRQQASLDLTIDVPADVDLAIVDSSGDVKVTGVSLVSIRDSSGDVRIDNVKGDLSIEDSSGDVEARDVIGNVTIEDSSGDLRIDTVTGNVEVRRDSSGDIDIAQISGSVEIGQDSSGDIEVNRVAGDFSVLRDGSGSIRHRDVEGSVSVPSDD